MVNKFINIFWNICEKPVRFNSRTKYDLELDSYLVNYSGDECIIEKLSTNLRRIRMESIGLFEEVKEKNKDDIEKFLN